MSLFLRVANLDIQIRGQELQKIMTAHEKRLLMPFLICPKSAKNCFVVNIKFIRPDRRKTVNKNGSLLLKKMEPTRAKARGSCGRNTEPRLQSGRMYKSGSLLLKKIKSYFPAKICQIFFEKNWLFLSDKELAENTLSNDIIMSPYCFLISGKKPGHCEIFLKKDEIISQKRANPVYMPGLIILKLLFRLILNSKHSGILLHASSIENNGLGYVFIGPSGYGKSTIVKMLGPGIGLSDETAVIKKTRKGYMVFASPWWNKGRYPSIRNPQKGVPLKAIFFIERSGKTGVKKIAYKEALAELIYRDNPFQQLRFFDNKTGIKNFYLFARDIIKDVPAFRLRIKKHKKFKKEFKGLLREFNLG